jgi:hypothetical protein
VVSGFELIWPSGDIDEQFGGQVDEPFPNPDIDRAGPTARLVRDGVARTLTDPIPDVEGGDTAVVTTERSEPVVADEDLERWLADEAGQEEITDEVVLAVRRAVASIETGSLAARRRLVEQHDLQAGLRAGADGIAHHHVLAALHGIDAGVARRRFESGLALDRAGDAGRIAQFGQCGHRAKAEA